MRILRKFSCSTLQSAAKGDERRVKGAIIIFWMTFVSALQDSMDLSYKFAHPFRVRDGGIKSVLDERTPNYSRGCCSKIGAIITKLISYSLIILIFYIVIKINTTRKVETLLCHIIQKHKYEK